MQCEFPVYYNGVKIGRILHTADDKLDQLLAYDESSIGKPEARFYENFYANGSTPLDTTREVQYNSLWKFISPNMSVSPAPTVLDIGCGGGGFVKFLQKKLGDGGAVYGIDPALPQSSNRLAQAGIESVASLPSFPKKYSVITLLDVFEHFQEPEKALAQVEELLLPNGLLLIKVPNKLSTSYRVALACQNIYPSLAAKMFIRLYQLRCPPPHFFYHSAQSLMLMLQPNFRVIDSFHMSEAPLAGLHTRFWFVPRVLRPVAIFFALIYRVLSFGKRNDAIVVLAEYKK